MAQKIYEELKIWRELWKAADPKSPEYDHIMFQISSLAVMLDQLENMDK